MRPYRWMLSLLMIASAAALAACSSTPPPATTGSPAPTVAATPAPAPAPEAKPTTPAVAPAAQPAAAQPPATLAAGVPAPAFATFYRKKRFVGAALNTSVHVDRIDVADLDPGDYVKVSLTPGEHSFYSDEERDTLKVNVESGKEYFFRIELQAGLWKGHGVLQLVEATVGATEFKTWELTPAEDVRAPNMVVRVPEKP